MLILYSDRGLVSKGKPNLVLFHQLYWTVFSAFLAMGVMMYPVVPMLKRTLLETDKMKICLLIPLDQDGKQQAVKGRIVSLIYPFLAQIVNFYLTKKVRTYINGICPNKKMSCIGNYRRNLLFFETYSRWIALWLFIAVLEALIRILALKKPEIFSAEIVFMLLFGHSFLCISVLHGIVFPLVMTLPPEETEIKTKCQFYMTRAGELHPRRPEEDTISGPPNFSTKGNISRGRMSKNSQDAKMIPLSPNTYKESVVTNEKAKNKIFSDDDATEKSNNTEDTPDDDWIEIMHLEEFPEHNEPVACSAAPVECWASGQVLPPPGPRYLLLSPGHLSQRTAFSPQTVQPPRPPPGSPPWPPGPPPSPTSR